MDPLGAFTTAEVVPFRATNDWAVAMALLMSASELIPNSPRNESENPIM